MTDEPRRKMRNPLYLDHDEGAACEGQGCVPVEPVAETHSQDGVALFNKIGPYWDIPGGAMAFRYECMACDFKLVAVASGDLSTKNLAWLHHHGATHSEAPSDEVKTANADGVPMPDPADTMATLAWWVGKAETTRLRAEAAEAMIACLRVEQQAVVDLHIKRFSNTSGYDKCWTCQERWPCPTVKLITNSETQSQLPEEG